MSENKVCQNCKSQFTVEDEDLAFYKKIDVPAPTWCPDCRMMRRMVFWNERYFFKKVEKRTGKELITMYPPEAPIEIYEREYWFSDAWNPLDYGREIDWNRPFLAQFRELQLKVPMPARHISRSVNSDYSNNAADIKNCYLVFNADRSEDCMYAVGINGMKNSVAVFRAEASEMAFECYAVFNSYQCYYSSIVVDCRNVWFSYDCHNCSDCFGCVNLRSKRYCIFNEQYTKEEYELKLKEMDLGSYDSLMKWQEKFGEHFYKFPRRFINGLRNVNVSGDAMRNSKNTHYSFALNQCEDVKYSQSVLMGAKDSYDYTNWGNNVELTCETLSCGEDVSNVKFSKECLGGASNIEYSMVCSGSSYLFGCVGLRDKKYCILNKEYSKEEYEALVPKIKAHMKEMPYVDGLGRVYAYGEFFPPEFSPFAADESALPDFMEIDKETAIKYGLIWRDRKPTEFKITRPASELPDRISDVSDSITAEIIGCAECGKGYRVPAVEFQFLKRLNLPLSRFCPTCRVRKLILRRNFPKWYPGSCQCAGGGSTNGIYTNIGKHAHGETACGEKFISSYAPNRREIVYCEACYQQEVM